MNGEVNRHEDERENHHLQTNSASFRVQELREKREVKQRHLWIQQVRDKALPEDCNIDRRLAEDDCKETPSRDLSACQAR